MMEWFTIKQWLFLFAFSNGFIMYINWKIYQISKNLLADNVELAKMISKREN